MPTQDLWNMVAHGEEFPHKVYKMPAKKHVKGV